MRFGQFVTLSVFCRLFAFVIALVLSGCELYVDDDVPAEDAGEVETPDAGAPDAEDLSTCAETCAGEEFTPWFNDDGSCAYLICRPSYAHCACPAPTLPCHEVCYGQEVILTDTGETHCENGLACVLPTCIEMGCDGTQNKPLACPDDGPCFCAADGLDGWCRA